MSEIAPCCADPKNRVEIERHPAANRVDPSEKGEMVREQCSVCRRNHYILVVDPIKVGSEGGKL